MIFNKDDIKDLVDAIQSYMISSAHNKITTLSVESDDFQRRLNKLEKDVNDLLFKIRKIEMQLNFKADKKPAKTGKQGLREEFNFEDRVEFVENVTNNGEEAKKGWKGTICNRRVSFGGVQYSIKLDKTGSVITVSEDCFKREAVAELVNKKER